MKTNELNNIKYYITIYITLYITLYITFKNNIAKPL